MMKKDLTFENILVFYKSLNKHNQRELYNTLIADIDHCRLKNASGDTFCRKCLFHNTKPIIYCQESKFTPAIKQFIEYLKLKQI